MKILAISGSLRAASTNTALLRAAAALAPKGIEITLYEGLGDLPHFNPDLEDCEPPVVTDFRARIRESDGLLISCPEYAHGVPGVLKNALDWLVSFEGFVGKPVVVFNASPRSVHADAALREILATMSARLVESACLALPLRGLNLSEDAMVASAHAGAIRAALGRHARLLACAIPIAGMFFVVPNFSFRTYEDYALLSFGHHRESYVIRRGDRIFYYGEPTIADGANALVPVADEYVRPGDRLFTGPVDLSRTYMSEAWWYYLFPETTPGTRYIEMDPGIADAKGSGLARDLRTSDIAILSNVQREWVEPNDSSEFRNQKPNRVLQRDFCMVGEFGDVPDYLRERVGQDHWWQLWVKCDRLKGGTGVPTSGP